MTRKLIAVVALLVAGCNVTADGTANDMEYTRDDRTGICFAFGWVTMKYPVMTAVPCEKVAHLLKRKP